MSEPAIVFYYRGPIERGTGAPGYRWAEGFSENSEDGNPLYPWNTRRECQDEARRRGARAVFEYPKVKSV